MHYLLGLFGATGMLSTAVSSLAKAGGTAGWWVVLLGASAIRVLKKARP
jgi:hypothetical protein